MSTTSSAPTSSAISRKRAKSSSRGEADQPAFPMTVNGYGIAFQPALQSLHTEGRAIDMTIKWTGNLTVKKKNGTPTTITGAPRNGSNTQLRNVGLSYGVKKLPTDPPHWSATGH